MKFDVIIGNPPYQEMDGGDEQEGARSRGGAMPLYQEFVRRAKSLCPNKLMMIIPSRWFAGGRGLDKFRKEMLNDTRIRYLVDYPVSAECFPGVEIKGGVCYFLWDKKNRGDCLVTTIRGTDTSTMRRPLLEGNSDIFLRFNESISIFRKVQSKATQRFSDLVSPQKPFGFRTYYRGKDAPFADSVKLYMNKGYQFVSLEEIKQNKEWVFQHKVFISMAYGAGEDFPHQIINKPFYGEPNSCCTETYLVIGPFEEERIARNVLTYMATKFFRFLVMLRKNTQHASRLVYTFVPIQDFFEPWTDEKLYIEYGLTENEISFIELMVRPMELEGN